MKKKISIIIPVYKAERYLNRCVDSILNQTYQNLEIILVDDGSPDHSGIICDEYARRDQRIKVLHQQNGGQSKARNEAFNIAEGEYYCFVDADDYIDSKYIEILYNRLVENQADVSMCDFIEFKDEFVDTTNSAQKENVKWCKKGYDVIKCMHTVPGELFVVMWGKLFKKELFEKVRFPEGRICEDLAVLYRLYDKATKIVYSSETLYFYYRNNENSSTYKVNDKFYQDVYLALEEEINYLQEYHEELLMYPQKTYMYWLFDYYCKLVKDNKEKNTNKLKGLLKKYRELYRKNRELKKEKFYTFFYYLPDLYIRLKCK